MGAVAGQRPDHAGDRAVVGQDELEGRAVVAGGVAGSANPGQPPEGAKGPEQDAPKGIGGGGSF